jgi:hypothetical protein
MISEAKKRAPGIVGVFILVAVCGVLSRHTLKFLVYFCIPLELVRRVISRRHTAVGQLADFPGANDEHI